MWRDLLLPPTDRAALVQVVVAVVVTVALAIAVRRERALLTLVAGLGTFVLALMAMRTIH